MDMAKTKTPKYPRWAKTHAQKAMIRKQRRIREIRNAKPMTWLNQ
jgi:hypothetical protein